MYDAGTWILAGVIFAVLVVSLLLKVAIDGLGEREEEKRAGLFDELKPEARGFEVKLGESDGSRRRDNA